MTEIEEKPRYLNKDLLQNYPDFLEEDEIPLFLSTCDYVLAQVKEWLRIVRENEVSSNKYQYTNLIGKIDSSELLDRLLRGKGAFSNPPPRSFRHSWYDLVEYGEDICVDAYKTVSYVGGANDIFRVDGERWDIVEEVEKDNKYIVTYNEDENQILYMLSRATEEDFERLMHPRLRSLSDGKDKYSWKLTRIEEIE